MKKYIIFFLITIFVLSCKDSDDFLGKELVITVASKKVDCETINKTKCFLIKYEDDLNWISYHGIIENFTYQEGHEYIIKVKQEEIQNPQQDELSIKFILLEVISDKIKTSEITP